MTGKNNDFNFFFLLEPNNLLSLKWATAETVEDADFLLQIDLTELMNLEKERLGLSRDELVFIGMANLSKYYWCAWQYYLKAKREESLFFFSYFLDRLTNSVELGLLSNPPKQVIAILKIGDNIEYDHIQKLLKEQKTKSTSNKTKNDIRKMFRKEKDPMQKGSICQILHGENYPTRRWNFKYKSIVLVGVPDGITNDFVYEFKFTSKSGYLKHTLITAACQADVYGYYFKRSKRRVQIFCEEDDKVYTYEDSIDKEKVNNLLEKWIDMKKGYLPIKPKPWKCNICEFKKDCVLLK